MINTGYATINPVLSKVRNWGDDGSGIHGGEDNRGHMQRLDQDKDFNYPEKSLIMEGSYIDKKMNSRCYCDILMKTSSFIEWLIWWMKNGKRK